MDGWMDGEYGLCALSGDRCVDESLAGWQSDRQTMRQHACMRMADSLSNCP